MAPLLLPLFLLLSLSFSQSLVPKAELVIGNYVPDVKVIKSSGEEVKLSSLSEGKPIILSFIYTRCTSSCPLIIQSLKKSLGDMAGSYRVVLVDFDLRDSPADLRSYMKSKKIDGWEVVLPRGEALTRLTKALDFRFTYDEKTDMFAHPNVLVVLSPSLRVVGYILGLSYDPDTLSSLIGRASRNEPMTNPIRTLFLKCFRYDPVTGSYFFDWSFVAMIAGGLIPLSFMFYYLFLKDVLTSFRRSSA